MLESFFKLKENHTNVKTEVVAGLTTFMTMAYILAVNPSILSASGMDANAILMATAIASFIGCFCMALLANYPFALAPGLGLNAYFAYTVVGQMGYSWQFALLAVFVEGLIFVVLSLTNVREAIFNAIPLTLKRGVSVIPPPDLRLAIIVGEAVFRAIVIAVFAECNLQTVSAIHTVAVVRVQHVVHYVHSHIEI